MNMPVGDTVISLVSTRKVILSARITSSELALSPEKRAPTASIKPIIKAETIDFKNLGFLNYFHFF